MPDRSVHNLIALALMKRSFNQVNRTLDMPYKVYGSAHRKYFHDPLSAYLIGYALAGNEGGKAALIHLLTDQAIKSDSATAILLKILASKK